MSLHGPATEEAGADAPRATPAGQRFGPNSAEVAAFVEAVAGLTAGQWRKVVAARRLASAVIRDPSALPVDAVRAMARICVAAKKHPAYERARQIWREPGQVGSAIAHAAAASAGELRARVIIAFTESGTTALRCSKARPSEPVIAASPHGDVLRRTALYSGVVPLLVSPGRDTDEMVANATQAAVRSGFVREGDRVVIVAGVPVGRPGQTNLLKVETV